jgi:ribosomal protection tetracycline resistance protein
MNVYQPGGPRQANSVAAGQIAALYGLPDVRVGDYVGDQPPRIVERQFPPPTLEAVVAPVDRADRAKMRNALLQLAEQDPFIDVRQDDESGQISVSLYGDVQREVIEHTLVRDYGVRAAFRPSTVLHVERVVAAGSAEQLISSPTHTNISGRSSPDSTNPYAATLGLRIEPAATESALEVVVDVDVHLIPMYIYNTVDAFRTQMTEYVREALAHGLYGWQISGCRVTVWDSGYFRTGSSARDFRLLTRLVLRAALERAGTVVCEPYTRIRLEVPASHGSGVAGLLSQLGARVGGQFSTDELTTIQAVLPTRILGEIKRRLPGATSGEGVLEEEFIGYVPVAGPPPRRKPIA